MSVGGTLSEARYRAGLSVDELSERTRIRGTVIRSIEEDDYQACGGDLYVRGYVRALAGAVGIDAQPLIREYDMGRAVAPPVAATTSFDLPAVTEATAGEGSPADMGATRFDLPVVNADPTATAYDLPPVPEVLPAAEFPDLVLPPVLPSASVPPVAVPSAATQPAETTETRFDLAPVPEDLMAAGYDLNPAEPAQADSATKLFPSPGTRQDGPQEPAGQPAPLSDGTVSEGAASGPAHRKPRKRRGLFIAAAAVVLLAAGAVGISLASGGTPSKNTAATTVPQVAKASATGASAAPQPSASAAAKPSATAQASTPAAPGRATANVQPVTTLPVVSVAAYGPDGFADGDDPGNARYAVARDTSQSWSSQWYATAEFGMLKHGTGLLLDLGKQVTVTSIRLDVGQYGGSDLQIRVGNGTASPDLRLAVAANNVDGTVKLTLRHPEVGQYLLIWFTQLPPDGSGHYQASVSNAVVTGR